MLCSTEIFAAIPTHMQCQMLLTVAEKITNTLERCRLLLLAMKNFPSLVQEHGVRNPPNLVLEHGVVNCPRHMQEHGVSPFPV